MIKFLASIGDVYARGLNWLSILLIPIVAGLDSGGRFISIWSIVLLLTPIVNFGMTKAFLRHAKDISDTKIVSTVSGMLAPQIFLCAIILYFIFDDVLAKANVHLVLVSLFIPLRVARVNLLSSNLSKSRNTEYAVDQVVMSTVSFILLGYFVMLQLDLNGWLISANIQYALYHGFALVRKGISQSVHPDLF